MQLNHYTSAEPFYDAVRAFLLRHEAENNLFFGILDSLIRYGAAPDTTPYFATVEQGGAVIAAALMTPPHNLVLAHTDHQDALAMFAAHLKAYPLPGVTGLKASSQTFAASWASLTGARYRVSMAERIYKVEQVLMPQGVTGHARLATDDDFALLLRWHIAFTMEAFNRPETEVNTAQLERIIRNRLLDPTAGGLYLWLDDDPVCMVGYTGPTPHGMRVGPVYTPPVHRGRGYGSACTAHASQMLLDAGRKFVFLFTDLANPTSNKIYQNIGYEPVADVDMLAFEV